MSKPATRHHTVPRLYLKQFANERGQTTVFDKMSGKHYVSNITDICVEKNFYCHAEDFRIVLEDNKNNRWMASETYVESHYLHHFEDGMTICLRSFIEHLDTINNMPWQFSEQFRQTFAIYVALQWLRSRRYRDHLTLIPGNIVRSYDKEWAGRHMPDQLHQHIEALRELCSKNPQSKHVRHIITPAVLNEFTRSVLLRDWSVVKTTCESPFYSSDNPVASLGGLLPINVHILDLSGTLMYPLSPKYLLLCSHQGFGRMQNASNRIAHISCGQVNHHNWIQYANCHRHVVVGSDSADFISGVHLLPKNEQCRTMEALL